MDATGTLTVDGRTVTVDGSAWFDHQWGDFISVGGGGWDWFAVNLADGTDLTLSLVRDADGGYPLIYGTVVAPDGTVRHLEREAFSVDVTARWTSPATGADYPAGWTIRIPGDDLVIDLRADRRRPGARHAGDHRGRLLGGLAGRPRDTGWDAARRRGLRRADGIRAGGRRRPDPGRGSRGGGRRPLPRQGRPAAARDRWSRRACVMCRRPAADRSARLHLGRGAAIARRVVERGAQRQGGGLRHRPIEVAELAPCRFRHRARSRAGRPGRCPAWRPPTASGGPGRCRWSSPCGRRGSRPGPTAGRDPAIDQGGPAQGRDGCLRRPAIATAAAVGMRPPDRWWGRRRCVRGLVAHGRGDHGRCDDAADRIPRTNPTAGRRSTSDGHAQDQLAAAPGQRQVPSDTGVPHDGQ